MLAHNYIDYAGTVQYWDTSDSEDRFHQNLADTSKRSLLEKLGYTSSTISYRFNSEGFRGDEFDKPECLCFGCSFTMGTGLPEDETWPAQFSSLTGFSVANLGHAGSSNDGAVRFAMHYIPFLKPKFAIWLQTDKSRFESLGQDSTVDTILTNMLSDSPYRNDLFIKRWTTFEINQEVNLAKNTLSFRQICNDNGTKSIILPRDSMPNIDSARDLMHPGKLSNKKLAEKIAQLV